MPERDNDSLEQFFRKAASKPEVSFDENDWKKLEARLDAENLVIAPPASTRGKYLIAGIVAVLLLMPTATWLYLRNSQVHENTPAVSSAENERRKPDAREPGRLPSEEDPAAPTQNSGTPDGAGVKAYSNPIDRATEANGQEERSPRLNQDIFDDEIGRGEQGSGDRKTPGPGDVSSTSHVVAERTAAQLRRDLMALTISPDLKTKQEAMVKLPGAEEAETGAVESVADQELASDRKADGMTPRLSLLLSFAPDFSGTAINQYSAPGKAFGAMIHYHLANRWSVSAGIVKNNKQYSGAGEDYTPPTGYWKYYTNGRVPENVDGACSILEFPLMVQYAFRQGARNQWRAGVGTSSYLMLDESYKYYFDEPNPGAKSGWASKESSRFMFNMINFTVAYERQLLPGLMLGIEPYVKIPVEEIGWTNLKLFSTGASVTMRYVILNKSRPSVNHRSRGPD